MYGFAYPSTRYAPTHSSMVLVGDNGITQTTYLGTLSHELGHILGLNHPDLNDGDATNDTARNLMFTSTGVADTELEQVYNWLTPLQCSIARATPHFLHLDDDVPLVDPPFRRSDRVLTTGATVSGSLTPRDGITQGAGITSEEAEQFLDVFYFYGYEGDNVTIRLESADFDAFLLLEDQNDNRLSQDDDSGGDLNAQISLTIPQTGDYSIGVTSFTKSVGAYELTFLVNE